MDDSFEEAFEAPSMQYRTNGGAAGASSSRASSPPPAPEDGPAMDDPPAVDDGAASADPFLRPGEFPCSPDHTCLARAIMRMAEDMGIEYRSKKEWHLIPIAHRALKSPLPPGWRRVTLDDGQVAYQHAVTHELLSARPYDQKLFERRIMKARLAHRARGEGAVVSPWMKLTEPSAVYYYDFDRCVRSDALPPGIDASAAYAGSDEAGDAVLGGRVAYDARTGRAVRLSEGSKRPGGMHAMLSERHILTLEKMKFTSWWTENSVRHYIFIEYNLLTEEFRVRIDKDETTYVLKTVEGKLGPVDCWDLHVTANLSILGRTTTLLQCSSGTARWLKAQARRLLGTRQALIDVLSKYEVVTTGRDAPSDLTRIHLRKLKNECVRLQQQLHRYRPKIAARFTI